MSTIKILITDDHYLIAESLTMLLGTVDKFEILGVVNNEVFITIRLKVAVST